MKEKSISMMELNKKDNMIKEYNKKIEGMMKKYEEEKNKNKNITLELKELRLKFKRISEEKNIINPNNDKDLKKTELSVNSNKLKNNNSLEIHHKEKDTNYEKAEPKSSTKLVKIDKYKDNFSDIDEEKSTKKFSSKIINEINDDYISISGSSNNENEIINNNLKESMEKIKIQKNKKETVDNDSETISEDNPELFKEVDKIMNMNKIDKNVEKTNSSIKDDKSTKLEIDKI